MHLYALLFFLVVTTCGVVVGQRKSAMTDNDNLYDIQLACHCYEIGEKLIYDEANEQTSIGRLVKLSCTKYTVPAALGWLKLVVISDNGVDFTTYFYRVDVCRSTMYMGNESLLRPVDQINLTGPVADDNVLRFPLYSEATYIPQSSNLNMSLFEFDCNDIVAWDWYNFMYHGISAYMHMLYVSCQTYTTTMQPSVSTLPTTTTTAYTGATSSYPCVCVTYGTYVYQHHDLQSEVIGLMGVNKCEVKLDIYYQWVKISWNEPWWSGSNPDNQPFGYIIEEGFNRHMFCSKPVLTTLSYVQPSSTAMTPNPLPLACVCSDESLPVYESWVSGNNSRKLGDTLADHCYYSLNSAVISTNASWFMIRFVSGIYQEYGFVENDRGQITHDCHDMTVDSNLTTTTIIQSTSTTMTTTTKDYDKISIEYSTIPPPASSAAVKTYSDLLVVISNILRLLQVY